MHVVAGVLVDGNGRVLIAQRPPGKHLAGLWEFPGGKLEPGESAVAALERELDEELGIAVDPHSFEALIRVPWHYGERAMLLEALVVRAWTGEARALDAAAIAWREPTSIDPATLAPADRPILAALRLPPHYLFSPEGATPDQLAQWIGEALARGGRLLQLRFPERPSAVVLDAVAGALSEAHRHGAQVLLHGDVERAVTWGVGVHLDASHLRTLTERPLPLGMLVAATCHDADDLAHAVRVGCDFATLSPVSTGRASSHEPLGWPRFARLAEAASLPVYALGGVGSDDLGEARMHAAQGIAGVC